MRHRIAFTGLALAGCLAAAIIAGCPLQTLVEGIITDATFTANMIQERTFIGGTAVNTVTYASSTTANPTVDRTPLGVDFNNDGKIDPVVAYGGTQAVIQILLSQGTGSTVDFLSLTLDSQLDMEDLTDVAVGDIDGDNRLDIVGGAADAVWYFHQPANGPTVLRLWGNQDEEDALGERIDASVDTTTGEDLTATIQAIVGPNVNLTDYTITVDANYANVEIGDFDLDGWNDIAATRTFTINLEPRPTANVEAIQIVDGGLTIFLNPGAAIDGHEWSSVTVGRHERLTALDVDGGRGLRAYDIDGDNDLDLVAATATDNNVQIAWFENPGPAGFNDVLEWTQWRIGSVRGAYSIDLADINGDDRIDVVGSGDEQMQVLLFLQPSDGPKREYDWDTSVIASFETYTPFDVKVIDLNNDGTPEVVAGCSGGAVRYFKQPSDVSDEWDAEFLAQFDPPGDVGLLGIGDFDGDGDIDLVTVVNGDSPNDSKIVWLKNNL